MVARQVLTQGIFTTLRSVWRIFLKGTALAVPKNLPNEQRATEPESSLAEARSAEAPLSEAEGEGRVSAPLHSERNGP